MVWGVNIYGFDIICVTISPPGRLFLNTIEFLFDFPKPSVTLQQIHAPIEVMMTVGKFIRVAY